MGVFIFDRADELAAQRFICVVGCEHKDVHICRRLVDCVAVIVKRFGDRRGKRIDRLHSLHDANLSDHIVDACSSALEVQALVIVECGGDNLYRNGGVRKTDHRVCHMSDIDIFRGSDQIVKIQPSALLKGVTHQLFIPRDRGNAAAVNLIERCHQRVVRIVGFNDIKAVIDILKILLQVIKDAVDFFFDIRGIEADIADNEIHLYLRGVNLIFDGYAVQKDLEGDAVCFPCAHQTAQKTGIKILQFLLCLFFVGAEQFIIRDVFYFRNRVTGALSVVGITEKNQINTCFCVSYLTSGQSAALPPLMTG